MRGLNILASGLVLVATVVLSPAPARAERATLLESYWDRAGTTIYSDYLVEHDDGSSEVVTALGGTVGDIRMVQIETVVGPGGGPTQLDFVRSLNKGRTAPVYWDKSWVYLTPDSAGTTDIAGDGELAALTAAADTWNAGVESCSYIRFKMKPAESTEVRPDGKNTLKFRHEKWCRPAYGDTPETCYRHEAAAITTLFHIDNPDRADNGLLLDTDIEVNAVDYKIATDCDTNCVTLGDLGVVQDLQNTLTHELGHVLGLDHTCWQPTLDSPTPPQDGNGKPVPDCDETNDPAVLEATMYTYQGPREVKKRTLEADDIDGICAVYPTANDPRDYSEVEIDNGGGCSCDVGGQRESSGRDAAWLVAALVFAGLFRGRACSRNRRR